MNDLPQNKFIFFTVVEKSEIRDGQGHSSCKGSREESSKVFQFLEAAGIPRLVSSFYSLCLLFLCICMLNFSQPLSLKVYDWIEGNPLVLARTLAKSLNFTTSTQKLLDSSQRKMYRFYGLGEMF